MLIEGRQPVIEALRAGVRLERVMLAQGLRRDAKVSEIIERAGRAGVPVEEVARAALDRLSERGAHQGVIARAAPFEYAELEAIVRATEGAERALVLALDHITDPGNLGAIARTAEVVGAAALLIPERRSVAVTPAAWKSAAGALAHMPVVREKNLVRAVRRLKEAGFWAVGASERAERDVWEVPLPDRMVLVLGSEGRGLSRLAAKESDLLVRLPQAGAVGSLNVAQAATALAYEWMRRGREAGR